MPPKVFDQMYDHILTDKGLEIFDQDWASVKVIDDDTPYKMGKRSFVILGFNLYYLKKPMTFTVYSKDGCPIAPK